MPRPARKGYHKASTDDGELLMNRRLAERLNEGVIVDPALVQWSNRSGTPLRDELEEVARLRPKTWGACETTLRKLVDHLEDDDERKVHAPCPFVSCQFHLHVDVTPRHMLNPQQRKATRGDLIEIHPAAPIEHTCVLRWLEAQGKVTPPETSVGCAERDTSPFLTTKELDALVDEEDLGADADVVDWFADEPAPQPTVKLNADKAANLAIGAALNVSDETVRILMEDPVDGVFAKLRELSIMRELHYGDEPTAEPGAKSEQRIRLKVVR